jgi:hypothetical protein
MDRVFLLSISINHSINSQIKSPFKKITIFLLQILLNFTIHLLQNSLNFTVHLLQIIIFRIEFFC